MPPKKRNRDVSEEPKGRKPAAKKSATTTKKATPAAKKTTIKKEPNDDDESMDKAELKEMLKDSIDEKADLTKELAKVKNAHKASQSELEKLKKTHATKLKALKTANEKAEEEIEETKNAERARGILALAYLEAQQLRHSKCNFILNPSVLDRLTASSYHWLDEVAPFDESRTLGDDKPYTISFVNGRTITGLRKGFDNDEGLSGNKLSNSPRTGNIGALMVLTETELDTVPADEDDYLVVGALMAEGVQSLPLIEYVAAMSSFEKVWPDTSTDFPNTGLHYREGGQYYKYPNDIQMKVNDCEMDDTIEDVWVPTKPGSGKADLCSINLNHMRETAQSGRRRKITWMN